MYPHALVKKYATKPVTPRGFLDLLIKEQPAGWYARIGKYVECYDAYCMVDLQKEAWGIEHDSVKPVDWWAERIYTVTMQALENRDMYRTDFDQYIINMALLIYKSMPQSFAAGIFAKAISDEEKKRTVDKILESLSIVGVVVVTALAALTLPIPVSLSAPISSSLKGIGQALINPKTYIDAGVDILTDTIETYLEKERREILSWVDALDDKTFLELSSLSDKISEGTRDSIEYIVNSFDKATKEIVTNIVTRQTAMDKAIAMAESNERIALESINHKIGEGVIDSYLSAFFERVV